MEETSSHLILVKGADYAHCYEQVIRFFAKTTLVRYDHVEVEEVNVLHGDMDGFSQQLNAAIAENKKRVNGFIEEVEESGVTTIKELASLQQGYPSKNLHILSHFLDGFIGIDSYFYNLIDDSHWLFPQTADAITATPEQYWLLKIHGFSLDPDEATLLHI